MGIGELAEGSLFDWQIGDLLDRWFDACKPGDIRGYFSVSDPTSATVLAGVKDGNGTLCSYITEGHKYPLSRMYPGQVSLDYMKADNKWQFMKVLILQRLLALLWATFVCGGVTKFTSLHLLNVWCVFGMAGLL